MSKKPKFVFTNDHVLLLRRMNVDWCDDEYGAPSIDPKRPYGNSSVEIDVCEILGWPMEGDDGHEKCYSSKQLEQAAKLHKQTETALQIMLCNANIFCGEYECELYKFNGWKLATPSEGD